MTARPRDGSLAPAASENVADSAGRQGILDALIRTAAERGFEHTSIEEVTSRAGLSPESFYRHFDDLDQCMTAAYDAFVARLSSVSLAAVDQDADWPQQVSAALSAAMQFLFETARHARVFAVEAPRVGPAFLERQVTSSERLAHRLRDGRRHYPQTTGSCDALELILVSGLVDRIRSCLLSEEYSRLLECEPEFLEVLLMPYVGREEACRIASMQRDREPLRPA